MSHVIPTLLFSLLVSHCALGFYALFFPVALVYSIYMRLAYAINHRSIFWELEVKGLVEVFVEELAHARRQFWFVVLLYDISEWHLHGFFSVEPNRWVILIRGEFNYQPK